MSATAPSPYLVREKRVIAISLTVTLIFGCVYILSRWGARSDWVDGTLRCLTFACVMVAVHVWGYQAYRRQWLKEALFSPVVCSSLGGAPSSDSLIPLNERLPDTASWTRIPWLAILAQQVFAMLFASIILDGGVLLQLLLEATVVYWAAVLTGLVLRRGQATRTDRVLFTLGYWPLAAFISVAQCLVWAIKGL